MLEIVLGAEDALVDQKAKHHLFFQNVVITSKPVGSGQLWVICLFMHLSTHSSYK